MRWIIPTPGASLSQTLWQAAWWRSKSARLPFARRSTDSTTPGDGFSYLVVCLFRPRATLSYNTLLPGEGVLLHCPKQCFLPGARSSG